MPARHRKAPRKGSPVYNAARLGFRDILVQAQMDRWSRSLARRKSTTCSNLDEVQRISTKLRLPKNIETPGTQFIETRRFAGRHKVSRIGCDEVWNSQVHPNCKEYDLFEIGRSHLGNPGVVVGSESRFLLQDMNLAFHLRHLVV